MPRELLIFCRRPGCDGIRAVQRPFQQRAGGYCSKRCAALHHRNFDKSDRSAAGKKSGAVRRAKSLERLVTSDMTPLEAFRLGYERGLQSKHRQIRRLVDEIRQARRSA